MSNVWRSWLMVWCGGVALFGLVLAGAAFEPTSAPVRMVFGLVGAPAPLDLDGVLRFSVALLGAVTLGWSLTLMAAIRAAIVLGERGGPVWRLITASVVVWYVVDCALSVVTGFWMNAVPNTGFLIAYLVPVLASGVTARSPAARGV